MPTDAPPLLAPQVLRGLLEVMPAERLAGLVQGYVREMRALMPRLAQAARDGRGPDLASLAHGSKGAALNLGLPALAEAAQALQHAGEHGASAAQVEAMLRGFEALLADTEAACAREAWWSPEPDTR